MARKRMRRRRDPTTPGESRLFQKKMMNDGRHVHVRQINATDEGVLYTHAISERPRKPKTITSSCLPKKQSTTPLQPQPHRPPHTPTLQGYKSAPKQYTIAPKKRFQSKFLNWCDTHHFSLLNTLSQSNPDSHLYRPSRALFQYINWTFHGSFTEVFMTFLVIYMAVMAVFAWFLMLAGNAQPACIVAAGEPFGANTSDSTRFSDAFALSWTTFTTVGYGMIYTAVGGDFHPGNEELITEPEECTWVVFLCTAEAFLGLLYAGMCAAILFGKVNRVQSHANIVFSNSVCLQYEEVEESDVDSEEEEEDGEVILSGEVENGEMIVEVGSEEDGFADELGLVGSRIDMGGGVEMPIEEEHDMRDLENPLTVDTDLVTPLKSPIRSPFIDQFNGCPVLKFQVVNELCNFEGSEIVDAIMKVVGVKFKGRGDKITHSQYVRVNLVDFEHPFFSRVWHGVHILDASSPLLTDKARQRIQANNGSWPSSWFEHPNIIQSKLDFEDLILTVAGVSNVSAVTVHAYKRYKIGDVLVGYNFAPLVFRDKKTGVLDVDLSLANDVREQNGLPGEDLTERVDSKESSDLSSSAPAEQTGGGRPMMIRQSTIRIKPCKSNEVLYCDGNLTPTSSVSS